MDLALKAMHIKLDRSVPNPIKTPPHLFELPGVFCAVAKRGSGKTTATSSLLRDYKAANLMDRCFLVSPNADSHVNKHLFEGLVQEGDAYNEATWASIDDILRKIEDEATEYYEYLDAKKVYAKLQAYLTRKKVTIDDVPDDLLMAALHAGVIDGPPKHKYGGKHPCLFIVMDDVQGTTLMSPSTKNPVNSISVRNRHVKKLGATLIFCTQSYSAQSGLQPFIRANATLYMIWRLASEDTRMKFAAELSNDINKDEFLRMYDKITDDDDPHTFMCLDMQAPKARRFRKNFDTIVT